MTAEVERHPCKPRPWRVRYRDHDGIERSRSFTRRADAERFTGQLRAATTGTRSAVVGTERR